MKLVWRISLVFVFLAPFAAIGQSVDQPLQRIGVAEFTELRRSYYIGGLFVESTETDVDALLTPATQLKRLEYRVTSPQLSQRRFSTQLSQLLIVGSSQQQLLQFDDALFKFQNIINSPFIVGDVIAVASDRDGRSKVFLNTNEVFTVENPGFLELLLSTWIGKKPPSTMFKEQILTDTAPLEVQQLFATLSPTQDRTISVKAEIKDVKNLKDNKDTPAPIRENAESLVKATDVVMPVYSADESSNQAVADIAKPS